MLSWEPLLLRLSRHATYETTAFTSLAAAYLFGCSTSGGSQKPLLAGCGERVHNSRRTVRAASGGDELPGSARGHGDALLRRRAVAGLPRRQPAGADAARRCAPVPGQCPVPLQGDLHWGTSPTQIAARRRAEPLSRLCTTQAACTAAPFRAACRRRGAPKASERQFTEGFAIAQAGGLAWYGGGCDLTPSYLFEDDARAFHAFWRGICDKHDPSV